jgi:glycerol kinase
VAAPQPVVLAIDAGTTGVRAQVFDASGTELDQAYRELTQHYPRPGWVEHDPDQIWSSVRSALEEVAGRLPEGSRAAAVGITNQRETVVAWDRRTGQPRYRAIVWQDRRTAGACDALRRAGHLPVVRERTGLVLDPYFSATKMHWLITDGGVAQGDDLALGTVDSWILWNLTGGTDGGVYATDATNASRTSLLDIGNRQWSEELCDLFGVPSGALAAVRPSCGRFGVVHPSALGADSRLSGVPISGIAGDQHAALFGQACFDPGMTKVTYGTGSFVLVNAGPDRPPPAAGLLTTLVWDLGAHTGRTGGRPAVSYALEGSVFTSGAAVQWLRDGVGIIDSSADIEPLARTVESSQGVTVVPAFAGLGSPHWDPYARGTILGLSRGINRAHLARAVIEAMSFQVRDVIDAMSRATDRSPSVLRVDGGASVMDLLLQLQADQTRITVARPRSIETTGLGAATLAGLAEGVWGTLDELADLWTGESSFEPLASVEDADTAHQAWARALDRSRGWVRPT